MHIQLHFNYNCTAAYVMIIECDTPSIIMLQLYKCFSCVGFLNRFSSFDFTYNTTCVYEKKNHLSSKIDKITYI